MHPLLPFENLLSTKAGGNAGSYHLLKTACYIIPQKCALLKYRNLSGQLVRWKDFNEKISKVVVILKNLLVVEASWHTVKGSNTFSLYEFR